MITVNNQAGGISGFRRRGHAGGMFDLVYVQFDHRFQVLPEAIPTPLDSGTAPGLSLRIPQLTTEEQWAQELSRWRVPEPT